VDSADERWDGFWCIADESYYTRCTRSDGSEQWFRIADEYVRVREDDARVIAAGSARAESVPDARRMLLLRRAKGQPILVGSLRRKVIGGSTR